MGSDPRQFIACKFYLLEPRATDMLRNVYVKLILSVCPYRTSISRPIVHKNVDRGRLRILINSESQAMGVVRDCMLMTGGRVSMIGVRMVRGCMGMIRMGVVRDRVLVVINPVLMILDCMPMPAI